MDKPEATETEREFIYRSKISSTFYAASMGVPGNYAIIEGYLS